MRGRFEPIADRPLGPVDLLDGSFAALRQRAQVIVTVVAVLILPVSLFEGWVSRDDLGGASLNEVLNDPVVAQEVANSTSVYDAGGLAVFVLDKLVLAIAGVAVSRIVGGWLWGRDTSAIEALRFTARRSGAIAVAFVAIHLLQLVGLVVLLLPGLAVIVVSSLTSPVLAAEELGPIDSIRRSWGLVRRRPGPVIGVILLVGIVGWGIGQAVEAVPAGVALFIGPDRAWPLISIASMLTSLISVPVTAAAMCLTYYDIRFRTEGLDLQRRIGTVFDSPTQ